jgi:hypothetical protein
MIKKIVLLSLFPILVLGGYAILHVSAYSGPDYDVLTGNQLSEKTIDLNSYVETPNKAEKTYNITIPESFVKVAEDDKQELFLEPDTLAIAVRVKANGYVYSSYDFTNDFFGKSPAVVNPIKSGVSIELYKESSPVSVSYLDTRAIATGDMLPAATSSIEYKQNGFVAHVDFNHPEIMIKFDVFVTLENSRLVMKIPGDSIVEYNPNLFNSTEQFYILRNIVLYPYFGSTKGETDGYFVIPDGSGALISLDKNALEKSSFSLDVYGRDYGYSNLIFHDRAVPNKEFNRLTIPVYGVVHDVDNTGFYVSIKEGQNYSLLNFKSAGVVNDYYELNFSYRYRESYQQYQSRSNEDQYRISFQKEPDNYDVTVVYTFLSGEEANYVGIAKDYKSDLNADNNLPKSSRKSFDSVPMKVDIIGSEVTMGVLKATSKEITSYNNVVNVVNTLKNDGYNNLNVSLKTFSLDDWGYRFDVYRQLGGKSDFKEMLDYMAKNNIDFSYYLDYVRSYSLATKEHAQTLSKREIMFVEMSWMYYVHKVNDTRFYVDYAKNDIEQFAKYDITNIAMNGLDRAIYTSWDNGIVYGTTNENRIVSMLQEYSDANINIGLYNPDSYLFAYLNTYYDAPISSNDFNVITASIPFVQLILGSRVDMYSPYLNFVSDETYTLLRLVEYGIFPSYLLTGSSTYNLKLTNSSNVYISEYSVLKNRIHQYQEFIKDGLAVSINSEMINHTFLAEGVVKVDYDNGSSIILNYNDNAVSIDSYTIPADDYVVVS